MNKKEKLIKLQESKECVIKAMEDPSLCEGTASVYSRVSGYYRATELWNKGKAQEFKERKVYKF